MEIHPVEELRWAANHLCDSAPSAESFDTRSEKWVQHLLSGTPSLAFLPQQSTFGFPVAALCAGDLAVVVSPHSDATQTEFRRLGKAGLQVGIWGKHLRESDERAICEQIRAGAIQLLYVSPENMRKEPVRRILRRQPLAFIGLEHAHCISRLSHDYRPEFAMLASLPLTFPAVPLHASTAVATTAVRQDVCRILGIPVENTIAAPIDCANSTYQVMPAKRVVKQIAAILQRHLDQRGIVFCNSRREVESYAAALNAIGIRAAPLHAGLRDEQRRGSLAMFVQQHCNVLVTSTEMEVDLPRLPIRVVIHTGLPKSIEQYYVETRTAQHGNEPVECVLLHRPRDYHLWRDLISVSGRQMDLRLLEAMRRFCASNRCRKNALREYFGEAPSGDHCGACDVCLAGIDPTDPTDHGSTDLEVSHHG